MLSVRQLVIIHLGGIVKHPDPDPMICEHKSAMTFSSFIIFFFIFISTPEGHERGTFWRIIISFQSGTENID